MVRPKIYESDLMRQALYLGLGLPYLTMALNSISTLRRFHKPDDMNVVLISDLEKVNLPERYADLNIKWENINQNILLQSYEPLDPFKIKTMLYKHYPADKSIFIDSDTIIMKNLNHQFKLLDYYDILCRPSSDPNKLSIRDQVFLDNISVGSAPHFSTAVYYYKKSAANDALFNNWEECHTRNEKNDQITFTRAVMLSQSKIGPLTKFDNATTAEILKKEHYQHCTIHHYASDYLASWGRFMTRQMLEIYSLNMDNKFFHYDESYFQRKLHNRISRGKKLSAVSPGSWRFYTPIHQRLFEKYQYLRAKLTNHH